MLTLREKLKHGLKGGMAEPKVILSCRLYASVATVGLTFAVLISLDDRRSNCSIFIFLSKNHRKSTFLHEMLNIGSS